MDYRQRDLEEEYRGPANMYAHYYTEVACNSTTWASEDAKKCGCRGGGWFLSDVDTWHKCSIHNTGQPHPEDDPGIG